MSKNARNHAQLLAGLAGLSTDELLTLIEGERVIKLLQAGRLNDISVDTIKRRYPHLIVRTSDGRVGMKLKHALSIAQPLDAA